MYKYVYFTEEPIEHCLDKLRSTFNNGDVKHYFKPGKYKDKSVVYVLFDLTTREYSDPIESKQYKGCLFFAPSIDRSIEIDKFERNKDLREQKIVVNLVDGAQLHIIPAQLEPRRVMFDFNEETNVEESPFSTATDYGRLAYSVYQEVEKNNIQLNDPRVKKLIMASLMRSYSLNIDLWNWIGCVSANDFDNLLSAAMGVDPESLPKKGNGC